MLNDFDPFNENPVPDWRGYKIEHKKAREKPVPTDAEIDQLAYVEWLEVLAGLWEAVGKPIDEKRLRKYTKELSRIPLGLLERAVSRTIRDGSEYQVVPTIGSIWKALRKELANPSDIDVVIERWIEEKYQLILKKF